MRANPSASLRSVAPSTVKAADKEKAKVMAATASDQKPIRLRKAKDLSIEDIETLQRNYNTAYTALTHIKRWEPMPRPGGRPAALTTYSSVKERAITALEKIHGREEAESAEASKD